MFKDILLVIVILSAFFVGYLFTGGVDRFFGNSGKWIKTVFEKNFAFIAPKNRPQKKKNTPDPIILTAFLRQKSEMADTSP